jgi:hypothetical protein
MGCMAHVWYSWLTVCLWSQQLTKALSHQLGSLCSPQSKVRLTCPVYNISARTAQKMPFHCCNALIAVETCLLSEPLLATAVIQLLSSRSLPGNGCTICYSLRVLYIWKGHHDINIYFLPGRLYDKFFFKAKKKIMTHFFPRIIKMCIFLCQ